MILYRIILDQAGKTMKNRALLLFGFLFLCELQPLAYAFTQDARGAATVLSFASRKSCTDGVSLPRRSNVASIFDFGGVGDGKTLNTAAFQKAVSHLGALANHGGSQLNIPAGKWLTGCFNLSSHFTFYLEKGAEILGSQNSQDWPLIEALPSYGRGRERPGKRHTSLLHGQDLTDVVITGENGTIDGQGLVWWNMWRTGTLNYTRGHLIEFVSSENITISNIVLANSPFWTVHPVYCNQVLVKNVTILAPYDSPNTDGVDSDSSSNVCIEDCYISNGDDLVALKSGWDEYGITFSRPTSNVIIRRVTGTSPFAGIAFGSEMSGGINNVYIEDVHVFHSSVGIRFKTTPGRGGYITNVTISGITLENVNQAILFTSNAGDHPDMNYNPDALPLVKDILIKNLVGERISHAGQFMGLEKAPIHNVCLAGIALSGLAPNSSWQCSNVDGASQNVFPTPCAQLQSGNWHSACFSTSTMESP